MIALESKLLVYARRPHSLFLSTARVVCGAIHDARIAALCPPHGVCELWSAERDFSRYPELVVRHPVHATT